VNSKNSDQFQINIRTITPPWTQWATNYSKKHDARDSEETIHVISYGIEGSGKSTLFRQLRSSYGSPFTSEEKQKFCRMILLMRDCKAVLEAMRHEFEGNPEYILSAEVIQAFEKLSEHQNGDLLSEEEKAAVKMLFEQSGFRLALQNSSILLEKDATFISWSISIEFLLLIVISKLRRSYPTNIRDLRRKDSNA
jgi:hypothetical protein